jgi:NAD(P)-dependent dehydrogenase (short-subunit alcohol dehydrogenase family)
MLLEDRSVVITGAGSGVGRASARLFAQQGARVVCADVQDGWVKETVRLIEADGGTAVVQQCDVTVEDDIRAAVGAAVDQFGRLDVMFNNVGVTARGAPSFEDHSNEEWDRLMNVNVRSVFWGCKYAVIRFKEQGGGGSIVNTGSASGLVGWGGPPYGATKGAVHSLSRTLAMELAPFNIRVNCICPGAMPFTNFAVPDATRGSQGLGEQAREHFSNYHPLGRPITAEDCAAAALYLASDQASNVTGVLLPVDGGYTAR